MISMTMAIMRREEIRQRTRNSGDALHEVERSIGREITPAERRSLHDRVTRQGYDYHRIVEEGKGLFGGC